MASTTTTAVAPPSEATTSTGALSTMKKAIPIVCPGHTRPLAELQFGTGPDDALYLCSACHDRAPMLRDGRTGDWIGTWVGHQGAVWSCRLSRDASLVATASGDFSVRVWDAVTGAPLWLWTHQHIVKCVDFSPRALSLASGGHEGVLRLYDLIAQEAAFRLRPETVVAPREIRPLHQNGGAVAISKLNWYDEEMIVIGCSDGTLRVYDTRSSENAALHLLTTEESAEIRDMELITLPKAEAAADAEERRILSVATGRTVYFYNVTALSATQPPELMQSHRLSKIHFANEGGISLHPMHGQRFLVGGSDLYIYAHDFTTGAELECYKGHHGPIRCLRYAPDGLRFASGSEDGTIRLWQ